MTPPPPTESKWKNTLRKTGRILVKVIAGIFIFILLLIILIQIPPVQNFARKKVVNYLEEKLDTKVEIDRIYIGIPRDVILSGIYIEDQQADTLFSGGEISVDISLLKLLSNKVEVNEIHFEDIIAKINRQLPDTTFNFQFIIDAFMPATPAASTDTAALQINIHSVILDNVRFLYKDVITGNDVNVKVQHLDGRIDVFDPDRLIFDIPTINLRGFNGKIFQTKPLATPEPLSKDVAEVQQPAVFQLQLKDITISDSYLDYRNDVSAFYTTLNLDKFKTQVNNLDLKKQLIDIKELDLANTFIAIRMGEKQQAELIKKEVKQEAESLQQSFWRFGVSTLRLDNNRLKFDDDTAPELSYGIDYAHLDARDLTLHADDFLFAGDTVSGKIIRGNFREQSGFILSGLRTDFFYGPRQAFLRNLVIKTPGTIIRRSAMISYPSLEAIQNDLGLLTLNANIRESRIQVKDILAFAPQLRGQPGFTNPQATWIVDGDVHGTMQQLFVNDFYFQGLQNTRLHIDGSLAGLSDMNTISADLAIKEFTTSRSDLSLFIPKDAVPDNITIPERIGLRGTVRGNTASLNANLAINTSSGNATINGQFKQLSNPQNLGYDLDLTTQSLNLGNILQMSETLGTLSSDLRLSGSGFDPKTMIAKMDGVITSVTYNNYNYNNINITGDIQDQQFNVLASITDPNIDLDIDASGNLSGSYPSIQLNAQIDSIKTYALNLTPDTIIYRGNIVGDFPVTDPDRLQGTLMATQSLMVYNGQRMVLDTMHLIADETDSSRYLQIISAPVNARLEGQYKLTELATVFQQAIQPYFNIMPPGSSLPPPTAPYDFVFNVVVRDHPLVKVFVPDLQELQTIQMNGNFNSDTGWTAHVEAPYLKQGTQEIHNLVVDAGTDVNEINLRATIDQFTNGPGFKLYKTNITATIGNNQVQFDLENLDKAGLEKYALAGTFNQPENNRYVFSLNQNGLLLNYDPWNVSAGNEIIITPEYVNVNNFELTRNNQRISLNSEASGNAPINIQLSNFQLATLTAFVKQDSLALTGTLNGEAQVKNILQQPLITSDLTISDLAFNQDTIGNVVMKLNNASGDVYNADVRVTGRGNDIVITGNYFEDGRLDLTGNINALQLNTIEGSTFGAVSNAEGTIDGNIRIQGTINQPDINGRLNFNNTAFTISMLGGRFRIDNESIVVNDQGIRFDTFTIKDSTGNTAVLDGYAYTTDFTNFDFALDLKADDFTGINSTRQQNDLFYGKLTFNADLHINGTSLQPVVDGTVRVNENTNFTVVLPQPKPGVAEREGIVEFVDMDGTLNDSLFMSRYDSLNSSGIVGFDITTNIELDREAVFNLVVDEANGDFMNLKGEANLTAGIDPSGNITLTGSYELYEGSYQFSISLLKRKFNIQRGSRIVWMGTPTDATVDLTAIYIANTAPLGLVQDQLSQPEQAVFYRQKLPFEVYLKMEGELMKPLISFDIVLPDDGNYNVNNDVLLNTRTRLNQLRQQPTELNKQVFALLLMNRFVSENPFASSGDGFSAGAFARQSVSKLLTEQLNQLASGLIQGVDIDFGISSVDDYTTGERQNRTDLNVGLSKRLLNDRLKVTVGSNFELEGPSASNQQTNNIGGNVAIDYQLSKDGRYLIRAYRKNEYEGVLEGQVIETGLSFIITLDYDHFRNLFRKPEKVAEKMPPPENSRPIKETENPIKQ
ncbi:MAG: translocation/assembly module TamB domain-containing protein [Chitinophagaceae bacterium]|nr:translocation/assembly module TamB domain-containing protein [Chitinophagaceae bacterium]